MDKKHKKKLKRATKKKKDKALTQEVQNKLNERMSMFGRRPDECSACNKEFPMTREAHMSWQVVVRNKEQLVRLFCPDCQQKARELVEKQNEV
jgi:hypothetical protein